MRLNMKKQPPITSFWNMKPMKVKVTPFSPKFIQPVNLKSYPVRTKMETKLIDKNPWGDKDMDKVPNIFDCKPLNKLLQGRPNYEDQEEYEQEVRKKKPLEPKKSVKHLRSIPNQSTQVKKTGMFLEKEKVYWGEGWTPGGWRTPYKIYQQRHNDLIKNRKVPSTVARSAAKASPARYKEFIKILEKKGMSNSKDWGTKAGDYDYGMKAELERLKQKQQEIKALREEGVPLKKEWAQEDPRMENYRKLVSMGVPSKIAVIAKSKGITDKFVEGKLKLKDLEKMFKEKGEQRWEGLAEKKRINTEKLRKLGFSSYEAGALSTRSIKNVDEIVSNVKKKGIEQTKKDIGGLADVIKKKQSEHYFTKLKGNPKYLEQRRKAERIRREKPGVKKKLNEYNMAYRNKPEVKEMMHQKYAIQRIKELVPGLEIEYSPSPSSPIKDSKYTENLLKEIENKNKWDNKGMVLPPKKEEDIATIKNRKKFIFNNGKPLQLDEKTGKWMSPIKVEPDGESQRFINEKIKEIKALKNKDYWNQINAIKTAREKLQNKNKWDKKGVFLPELYDEEDEEEKELFKYKRTKEEIMEDKRLEEWGEKYFSEEAIKKRDEQEMKSLQKKMGLLKDKRAVLLPFNKNKINVETPEEVKPLVDILNRTGTAYIVGGFVRDTLLQKPPKDIDIEVHGMTPEQISQELKSKGYSVNEVGKSFGVLKVSPKTGSRRDAIDVSVPRIDSTGRKPVVELLKDTTPKEAAGRRDFTINAIMYDTKADKVVDPYGGLKDLEQGKIRAVSDKAFSEDPLRVVRAAQFASRFNFDIEPKTAAEAKKANMKELSGERIQEELKKVSEKSKKPSKFFRAMDEMGQLETVFPEVAKLKGIQQDPEHHPEGDAYEHTMEVIDRIALSKDKNHKMFLTGVLHDTGKATTMQVNPKTGKLTAIGHEEESAKITKNFMDRLHYPVEDKKDVVSMVTYHMEPHHLVNTGATKFKHKNRLLAKVAGGYGALASNPEKAIKRFKDVIDFAKQDKGVDNKLTASYNELQNIPAPEKYKREAKGEDVIAEGYKGKEVGKRLEELYKNQVANIEDKRKAKDFLNEVIEEDKNYSVDAVQDIQDQEPSQDIVEDMVESIADDTTPYEGSAQELIDTSENEK
jgi:tRNA nucleotidyltransferase (CCA-adding enzyme)